MYRSVCSSKTCIIISVCTFFKCIFSWEMRLFYTWYSHLLFSVNDSWWQFCLCQHTWIYPTSTNVYNSTFWIDHCLCGCSKWFPIFCHYKLKSNKDFYECNFAHYASLTTGKFLRAEWLGQMAWHVKILRVWPSRNSSSLCIPTNCVSECLDPCPSPTTITIFSNERGLRFSFILISTCHDHYCLGAKLSF